MNKHGNIKVSGRKAFAMSQVHPWNGLNGIVGRMLRIHLNDTTVRF
jgi:hypothetical protein